MSNDVRLQALALIDSLDHMAEDYGEYRLTAFREEDADLLRRVVSQTAILASASSETLLLLFVGWLRACHVVDVHWDNEQYTYVVSHIDKAVGDLVAEFLGGLPQGASHE